MEKRKEIRTRCLEFSIALVRFCEALPGNTVNTILVRQLLRAGTSIGANVVEAYGSGTKRDFANFFTIALKSAKETKYWLYLFRETRKGDKVTVSSLIDEVDQLAKIVAAAILTSKGKR